MRLTSKKGFTLIELLVAMVVASIVVAAIVSAYQIQVRGKNTQAIITDMNQTARAALEVMSHEIRMAGCDPDEATNARIILMNPGELIFSFDINDDANTNQPDGDLCDRNEVIRYYLDNDADFDGVNDAIASGVRCDLMREEGPGNDPSTACGGLNQQAPLALNVDAINFVYLDVDGNVTTDPDDVRNIEITMVVRAGETSGGFFMSPYTNNETYNNQQGVQVLGPQGDDFRRICLRTSVTCRNLGL